MSTAGTDDDRCDDPVEEIEKDGYIAEARNRFGAKDGREECAKNYNYILDTINTVRSARHER